MLSHEDNELMCRVGPGTAMGAALRRYWVPFLQSSDLSEPGGDPRRVELLGQTFVAFRGTDGVIGLLDEACCHRGPSLALGRVEGCGIRCLFHGWKFAADGTLLETPNVSDPRFRERVRAKAYSVREAGGLIWTYIGPKDDEPPFPAWKFLDLPDAHRITSTHIYDCNYVQVTEALVDSSHLSILHSNGVAKAGDIEIDYGERVAQMGVDLAPRLEVQETDSGFRYAAIRRNDNSPDQLHTRITQFVAPYFVFNANGDILTIMVPASDVKTLFFHVFWDEEKRIGEEPLRSAQLKFVGLDDETLAHYGVGLDTPEAERPGWHNKFMQDRVAMREGRSFTGLAGLIEEDVAVAVSSGPIRNREIENLCPADLAVAQLYRALLKLVRTDPPIVPTNDKDRLVRGWTTVLNAGENWRTLASEGEIAESVAKEHA